MTTTVLKLSDSDAFLKTISIKTIKDVRALDVDLLLILTNGDHIVISSGAMHALNSPDLSLEFSDGKLPLARVFQQIDRIDVSPEANLTVSSKEITRYNQNNARTRKAKTEEEEGDKPVILEQGEKDPAAATVTAGIGGNADAPSFSPMRAADHQRQLADAEVNSDKEKDKSWGVQWPIAAGALALLAAAGGGGGGGSSSGGGSSGGSGGTNGNGNNGGAGPAGANGANLSDGERVSIPLPKGMSAKNFLTSLKGISANWGGAGVYVDDSTHPNYKSYQVFDKPLGSGEKFTLFHQGDRYAKSSSFSFQLSPDGKQLMLAHLGESRALDNTDLYHVGGAYQSGREYTGAYDIGNINVLYEVKTSNSNTLPAIKVRYDGTRSAVGDVISLYEGDKLLASKVLGGNDIGKPDSSVNIKVSESLGGGEHHIVTRYTEATGHSNFSNEVLVKIDTVSPPLRPALLQLRTQVNYESLNLDSESPSYDGYPTIVDGGNFWAAGNYQKGPVILGYLRSDDLPHSERYLFTLKAGGKLLAFGEGGSDFFSLEVPAGVLAPGFYEDLSVTATQITPGGRDGETHHFSGLSLGWYWASQALGNTSGGPGKDTILLGSTMHGRETQIQTGAGEDTVVIGLFGRGRLENPDTWEQDQNRIKFEATVTDFAIGTDKIRIFEKNTSEAFDPFTNRYRYRDITNDNLQEFVKETAPLQDGAGTKLVVDLDGAASGTQTYTLYLQNVAYQPANTHTLFGV